MTFSSQPFLAVSLWIIPILSALLLTVSQKISFRIVQIGGIYLASVLSIEYGLGMLGLLSLTNVFLCHCILFLISISIFYRKNSRFPSISDFLFPISFPSTNLFYLCISLALVLFSVGLLNLLKPPTHIDFLWGNLNDVANWLQTKTLITQQNSPLSFYHSHGFLLTLWFILPFHSDLMINLQNLPLLFLILVAIYHILQHFEFDKEISILASLSLLSFPFFYTDLWKQKQEFLMGFFFLLSLIYMLEYLKNNKNSYLLYSFSFLGFSIGCKSSMLVVGAVIYLIYVVLLLLPPTKNKLKWLVIASLCCFCIAFMWPLRNWIVFENPFFPTKVAIGKWVLFNSVNNFALKVPSIQESSLAFNLSFSNFISLLKGIFKWYGLVGLLTTLTLPILIVKAFRSHFSHKHRIIAGLAVFTFIAYLFLPVTALSYGYNIIAKGGNVYYSFLTFILSPILLLLAFYQNSLRKYFIFIFITPLFLGIPFYLENELKNITFVSTLVFALTALVYCLTVFPRFRLYLAMVSILASCLIFSKFEGYAIRKRSSNELFSFTNGVSTETITWINTKTRNRTITLSPVQGSTHLPYPFYGYHLDNRVFIGDTFSDSLNFPAQTDYLIICTGKKEKLSREWQVLDVKIVDWAKKQNCKILFQTPTELILGK